MKKGSEHLYELSHFGVIGHRWIPLILHHLDLDIHDHIGSNILPIVSACFYAFQDLLPLSLVDVAWIRMLADRDL